MTLLKGFKRIVVLALLIIPVFVLAQDEPPWKVPIATGITQPVYIVDATIDGIQIDIANDWIGVFDDTLTVGKDQLDVLPAVNPITTYIGYTSPGVDPLRGARTGFPMSFKIWDAGTGQVANVVCVEGLTYFKDKWFMYYGMADSHIGVAVSQ